MIFHAKQTSKTDLAEIVLEHHYRLDTIENPLRSITPANFQRSESVTLRTDSKDSTSQTRCGTLGKNVDWVQEIKKSCELFIL